jgi:hypothetical protein
MDAANYDKPDGFIQTGVNPLQHNTSTEHGCSNL